MLRHTSPGPWKWTEGTPTIVREWNGRDVCIAQVKAADLDWHEDMRMASIESGANAKLIAASPLLAEQNQKMRDALEEIRSIPLFANSDAEHVFAVQRIAREVLASITQH